MKLTVDADITRAETLPGAAYRVAGFARAHRRARSSRRAGSSRPTRRWCPTARWRRSRSCRALSTIRCCWCAPARTLRCLSNVCTHRGAILCDEPCAATFAALPLSRAALRARRQAHARARVRRRRRLPAPSAITCRVLPTARFGPLVLTSLSPAVGRRGRCWRRWAPPGDAAARRARARSRERARLRRGAPTGCSTSTTTSRGCTSRSCTRRLAQALDFGAYRTELDAHGTTQIGITPRAGEDTFDGSDVAAYYFWLFPNLMLNFYPWGLLAQRGHAGAASMAMRVHYRALRRRRRAGASVAPAPGSIASSTRTKRSSSRCSAGLQSRLYGRGRYSPSRETGVHHFHRLLWDRAR